MTRIDAISSKVSFGNNNNNTKRKNIETAATGVGAAGTLGVMMKNVLNNTKNGAKVATQSTNQFRILTRSFSKHMRNFKAGFIKQMLKLEGNKFLGPIVKSPAAKKFAGIAGGILALFVVVGEGAKAIDNGNIILDDFTRRNAA